MFHWPDNSKGDDMRSGERNGTGMVGLWSTLLVGTVVAGTAAGVQADVRSEGAFGFPQQTAQVVHDTPLLRVSAACDGAHLFVQAVMWTDGDSGLGLTADGREIGDNSSLVIDVDADGKATANVDRSYALNPWPSLPGLRYSVSLGDGASTGLQGDSKGRGAIEYVKEGVNTIRVDSFVIPLTEIKRAEGQEIRFAYIGHSTAPEITVNSVGYKPSERGRKYYAFHLPHADFHAWTVKKTQTAAFDLKKVREPREAPSGGGAEVAPQKPGTKPQVGMKVGEAGGPPEIQAKAWRNWKGSKAPTLAGLQGKVVVVEFWATWCGPCVAGIPHLNDLHKKHASKGLVILSLTDQDPSAVNKFVSERDDMTYAIGMGSTAVRDYGVTGIPHAFVIDRSGTLIWHGHPATKEFDEHIEKALAAKSK